MRQLTAKEFNEIVLLQGNYNIDKITVTYPEGPDGTKQELLTIQNVEVVDDLIMPRKKGTHALAIRNSVFKKFIVQDWQSIGWFDLSKCHFKEFVAFDKGIFSATVYIQFCTFDDDFNVNSSTLNAKLIFAQNTFNKNVNVAANVCEEEFLFHNCTVKQTLGFWEGTYKKKVEIAVSSIKGLLEISDRASIEQLVINRESYVRMFILNGLREKTRLIIDSTANINVFILTGIINKDALLVVSQNIYQLIFRGITNLGLIYFKGGVARKFPFSPKGDDPKLNTFLPNHPDLQIINSDLGKTTFIDCDLAQLPFTFKSSKITDVYVIGTRLPNQITTLLSDGVYDYEQHQQGYSQIKKIYESKGDRVEANRYFAKEMEAYRQTLSWCRFKDWGEQINLLLNYASSFYGQKWGLALLTTIVIGALFYWAYCSSLGYITVLPTANTFSTFTHLLSYYLEFINPIHKADYIAEQLLSKAELEGDTSKLDSARSIEGVSRILIAYLLYQLVQAFRKHGKSSG